MSIYPYLNLIWSKELKSIAFLLFFLTIPVIAQWQTDPDGDQKFTYWGLPPIVGIEDNNGGAFVSACYAAPLDTAPYSVRIPSLFKIDKYGIIASDSVSRVGGSGESYRNLKLVADGFGNFLAPFVDRIFLRYEGGAEIYRERVIVQKLDKSGQNLWGNGVYLTEDTVKQDTFYDIVVDGLGGCYVYYHSYDSMFYTDNSKRYLQHVSNTGEKLWGNNGILLYHGMESWGYSSNKMIKCSNGDLMVRYYNREEKLNEVVRINNQGEVLWKINSQIEMRGSILFEYDSNTVGILGAIEKVLPVRYDIVLETFSKEGVLTNKLITDNKDIDSFELIENVLPCDDVIYYTFKERINTTKHISNFQGLQLNGENLIDGKGIQLFDSNSVYTKMFKTSNSFLFVTRNICRKLDLQGNDVWNNRIVKYTNRDMGYYDVIIDGNGGFIVFWLENLDGIRIQQVNANGELGVVLPTAVEKVSDESLKGFYLEQNYPNPFNPVTVISYHLPVVSKVYLKIYDVLGKEITTLVNETKEPGIYQVEFDASFLPSGVYFYQFQAGSGFTMTRKLLLLK